jgi:hypothetical protein
MRAKARKRTLRPDSKTKAALEGARPFVFQQEESLLEWHAMARARNIKPAIMDNEVLAVLAPLERLLFIYLWMLADREGRLEDRPKRIAAQALPFDQSADVDAMLDSLARSGFIGRYSVGEIRIVQITAFAKHQTPHVRESASTLPAPENVGAIPVPGTTKAVPRHDLGNGEASPRSPDSLIPDSLIPDSLIADCGGKPARKRATPIPSDFAISDRVMAWAASKSYERLSDYLEFFTGRMRANGKTYLDWDETFMNCVREDWPGYRQGARAPPAATTAKQREAEKFIKEMTGRGRDNGKTIDSTAKRIA